VSKKNPIIAVADDLAAKSRILRGAAAAAHAAAPHPAPVPDVIEKLSSLGEEQRADERAARAARRQAVLSGADALLDRARAVLEEKRRLRVEHGPLVQKLSALDWDAITKRARVQVVPGSMATVVTRIGFLRRLVEEVWPALLADSDKELNSAITAVETCDGSSAKAAEYEMNGLRRAIEYGTHTEFILGRMKGIRRVLDEIATDLDASDAQAVSTDTNEAPLAQEAK
jgi:hypothetical protein